MKKTLALILLFAASTGFAEDKPVHVFILSGQSNMAGMDPETGFVPEARCFLEMKRLFTSKSQKEVNRFAGGSRSGQISQRRRG